jgi:hypothetical protein
MKTRAMSHVFSRTEEILPPNNLLLEEKSTLCSAGGSTPAIGRSEAQAGEIAVIVVIFPFVFLA